jgi:cysteinyl-tRNA synthetase
MSKSKGEFLTVSLLESKGYDPIAYRFFALQSHYRKPLVFSYEALDQASATYNKLLKRIAKLSSEGEVDTAFVEEAKAKFLKLVGNDINTALGITCVYDILKADTNDATKRASIKDIDYVLSLNLVRENEENDAPVSEKSDFEKEIEALIAERTQAKKDKNFARADEIRNDLKARGVTLLDTREGTTYTIE